MPLVWLQKMLSNGRACGYAIFLVTGSRPQIIVPSDCNRQGRSSPQTEFHQEGDGKEGTVHRGGGNTSWQASQNRRHFGRGLPGTQWQPTHSLLGLAVLGKLS